MSSPPRISELYFLFSQALLQMNFFPEVIYVLFEQYLELTKRRFQTATLSFLLLMCHISICTVIEKQRQVALLDCRSVVVRLLDSGAETNQEHNLFICLCGAELCYHETRTKLQK